MNRANHPLFELVLARFREFFREPEAVFWAVAFPVLLAAGLGVAFRERPADPLPVATSSAAVARALAGEAGLTVETLSPDDAERALQNGRVALLAQSRDDGTVEYRFDDTNPEARTARLLADRAVQRDGGRTDPVAVRDQLIREPGSRYIDFLIPGLVGLGIMSNAVWGIGFSIVDARRRKLTKRLVATPMSRTHYLASYLVWRMAVLVLEVGIPVAFGSLVFGVPVRGSLFALVVLSILASLCFSAMGLLIASRARTIEAVSGLMNLLQIPMWILSGVFFSAERFPATVQPIIRALPLTALIDALRLHMLQGAGLVQVAPQIGVLVAWLVVSFTLALKLFRWR